MNILKISNRQQFREWLSKNADSEKECWIANLKRGKPIDKDVFYYLDAVEEALCFGWIDSVYKKINDVLYQRFTPRTKASNWTALNIARCQRLETIGLMTAKGRAVVPSKDIALDKDVLQDIKNAGIYNQFIEFPILYQLIRISNLASIKKLSIEKYNKSFCLFVKKTKDKLMYGQWNDYGRLL